MKKGTRLSLPFWLSRTFSARAFAFTFLPLCYTARYQRQLFAAPTLQNLQSANDDFYALGQALARLTGDTAILDSLQKALDARYQAILQLHTLTHDHTYAPIASKSHASNATMTKSIKSAGKDGIKDELPAGFDLHANVHAEAVKKYDANHFIHRLCKAERRLLAAKVAGITELDAHVRRKTAKCVQSNEVKALYQESAESEKDQVAQQEQEQQHEARKVGLARNPLQNMDINAHPAPTAPSALKRSATSWTSSMRAFNSMDLARQKSKTMTMNARSMSSGANAMQRSKSSTAQLQRQRSGIENMMPQSKRSRLS